MHVHVPEKCPAGAADCAEVDPGMQSCLKDHMGSKANASIPQVKGEAGESFTVTVTPTVLSQA